MSRFSILALALAIVAPSVAQADVIDGEDLLDPTRPLGGATPIVTIDSGDMLAGFRASRFQVSFVRASESSPMAVINEQRVTVGDVVSGATVVAIDRGGVTLSINDEEQRVSMFDTRVKRAIQESN